MPDGLNESLMNHAPQLEAVEPGDAVDQTRGLHMTQAPGCSPTAQRRQTI
jgi:hypothetical protein